MPISDQLRAQFTEQLEGFLPAEDTPTGLFLFEQRALVRAARAAFQRRVGISQPRMQVLGFLYLFGELSQAELERRLGVDGAAVTRQVKRLEAEGLLLRRADPADNRFTLVTLTAAGREKVCEVAQTAREFIQTSLAGVEPQDLACARHVLARIRANLEQL